MRYVLLHSPSDRLTEDQLTAALSQHLSTLASNGVHLDYVPEIRADKYMIRGATWLVHMPSREELFAPTPPLVSEMADLPEYRFNGFGLLAWQPRPAMPSVFFGLDRTVTRPPPPPPSRWQRLCAWWRWVTGPWRADG